MTQTQSELRQASIRAVTGTSLDYNGDWMALFDLAAIPKGNFDERMLAWINVKLGATYTNVNNAMQALATANNTANFSSLGTFIATTAAFSLNAVSFVTTQHQIKRVIAAADTGQGVMSFWMRGSVGSTANPGMTSNLSLENKGPVGNIDTRYGTNGESFGGANIAWDNSAIIPGTLRMNLGDSTGGQTLGHNTLGVGTAPNLTNELWQHWLWAWRTDQASGVKRQAVYANGVQVSGSTADTGVGGAFNVNTSIADGFFINSTPYPGVFEIAQFALWTDVNAQIVTGSSPSSVVAPATVAKFYNNGPVDFGATGINPLGSQPLLYYNDDGTGATFPANKGSDGASTFITANTLLTSLQRAAIGPGQTPDRPYFKWWAFNHGGNTVFVQSTGLYAGVTNFGKPIALGDLLLMAVKFNAALTAFDHNPVVVTGGGSAWTLVPNSKQTVGGGRPINFVLYYKFAEAADVTASRADWTRPPTITWTTNADTYQDASYLLLNYGNCTAINTSASQSNAATATGQTIISPSLTAPSGKSLRVDVWGLYQYDDSAADYAPPSTQDCRFIRENGYSSGVPFISDEKLNAAGATGTRTAVTSNTAAICNNVTCALILV